MRYRIDVETLRREESASTLGLNDLARVHLELSSPLVFDSYRRNRVTGSLIVIDEATNETVAAGVILDTEVEERGRGQERAQPQRPLAGDADDARAALAVRSGIGGATLWFTGLPGAGKSTVAAAVEERLLQAGLPAFLLDGDNLRHGLNGDLGFDEHARSENVRRTAHVARLLAESGTIALVSLVSPYAADREIAAALHAADDLAFIEMFVDAPLELCEQRDPKGLYARARAGELAGMTGVGAPYEAPDRSRPRARRVRGNGRAGGRARARAAAREGPDQRRQPLRRCAPPGERWWRSPDSQIAVAPRGGR